MLCPIVIYISKTKNTTEYNNLFFNFGVSLSSKASSSADLLCTLFSPLTEASYPAFSTA